MNNAKQYLPVLEEKFEVRSYSVDMNMKLKLNFLTAFIQEAAWKHAQHLDFGPDYLQKNNVAWMLTRLMVEMDVYPLWRDEIIIETWPKTIDGPFYVRDFFIKNGDGKKIGAATSYWLLVDLKTKKPKLPDPHAHILTQNKDRYGLNVKLTKIRANCTLQAGNTKAEFGDIDLNNHVNSNKYVEWITNIIPIEIMNKKPVRKMQINYLHEVHYGDDVILKINNTEGDISLHIEGLRNSDSSLCFQAIVKY